MIIFFSNVIFAKYNIVLETNNINLLRDTIPPEYVITYSDTEWTNSDVILKINTSEPIEEIEGFEINNEGTILTKVVSENENNEIILKDLSGNKTILNYSINNIDKIKPQIIGVNNGDIVKTDIKLEYKDNVGIKEIFIDKYAGLDFRVFDDFYDTDQYLGIDVTDTKIKVILLQHPRGTSKYKYYLDDILDGISEESTYQFNNLNPGEKHKVKVEAIDSQGNLLAKVEKNVEMNYFSEIETIKTDTTYIATLKNIDSRIKRYEYHIMSDENVDDSLTFFTGSNIENNELTVTFDRQSFGKYTSKDYIYRIHIHLYDENNNHISTLPINILFGKTVEESKPIDIYNLTENGKYQIIVTDFAGNKEEYDIEIQK